MLFSSIPLAGIEKDRVAREDRTGRVYIEGIQELCIDFDLERSDRTLQGVPVAFERSDRTLRESRFFFRAF